MINFTKNDNLNKIISNNNIAIIQYGTATCMPCHSIKNRITTWQENHKEVVAYYISLEENMKSLHNEAFSQHQLQKYISKEDYLFKKSGYFSLDEILEKVSSVSDRMKQQQKRDVDPTQFIRYLKSFNNKKNLDINKPPRLCILYDFFRIRRF